MTFDPALSSDFYSETNSTEKDNTIPRFYLRAVQNEFRSHEEGRPIFEDLEYVEIIIPGNRGTVVDTLVKEEHRQRWPIAYARFKQGEAEVMEGTPIAEWPGVTRSQAEELKFLNIRTVEALANLDDHNLQRAVPMGGNALREKAKRYLLNAAGSAPAEALAAKVDDQAATIAALQQQVEALLAEKVKGAKSEAE